MISPCSIPETTEIILEMSQQRMGDRIGRQTGTRLVKSIPTTMARLRACPIEASCPCSLYSGGKDFCSASIISINSVTCELMDGERYWLSSSGGDSDIVEVNEKASASVSRKGSQERLRLVRCSLFTYCKNLEDIGNYINPSNTRNGLLRIFPAGISSHRILVIACFEQRHQSFTIDTL